MIVVKIDNEKPSKVRLQFAGDERRATSDEFSAGSALILTVVLTTLLAIIGVVFLLVARIDKTAATAASENRELNFAIDSVLAEISQQLVLDVPGVPGREYHDYPGPADSWLASLEPYKSGNNYYWQQVSNISGMGGVWKDLQTEIITDYQPNITAGVKADADGDGVADSIWVKVGDITSTKGKPIYAAIRIIDNGAMLNANTSYKFIPNADGSSQLQINLMALAGRPPLPSWPVGTPYTPAEENLLLSERDGYGIGAGLNDYESFVIWSYGELAKPYTPFDISDELELRYRFLLNHTGIDTRLEGWGGEFRDPALRTPVDSGGQELYKWFKRAHFDPNILDPRLDPRDPNYYAYRHIATTCNMDRIINPDGAKMVNINRIYDQNDLNELFEAIRLGFLQAGKVDNPMAAQIAVNLKDYRDPDSDVTTYGGYYGFETPCIYISELDYNYVEVTTGDPPVTYTYRSYAIEFYKPYFEDGDPNGWLLRVDGRDIPIIWSGTRRFHVMRFEDPNARLPVTFSDPNEPIGQNPFGYDPLSYARKPQDDVNGIRFDANSTIELRRPVLGGYITVDSRQAPDWLVSGQGVNSFQRDITQHKCIRSLWDSATKSTTLGSANTYQQNDSIFIQAHPANKPFTNIGEIGMVFRENVYGRTWQPADTENAVRLNLADPIYQQIFNYLTVFDPNSYPWNDPNETRVKGRININTAPWFVIAQLPWVTNLSLPVADPNRYRLAQAIIAYRDGVANGFRSIGQLMNVNVPPGGDPNSSIFYYALDGRDQKGFPDLTTDPRTGVDGAADDFEEGDLIFSRISNLVTVRSDVFTAYILVRIGPDGPQKRVLAILDRSRVTPLTGKVKIIALQPVPDPR
jgi:hypothetical protein